jgi:hypothetical protein
MSRLTILSVVLIVAVVGPGLVSSGVQAATPPVITSVILTRVVPGNTGLVYITINGRGFGTGPATVPAGLGASGIDTVKSSTTPSLGICDVNEGWNAGGKFSSSINVGHGCTVSGYNNIGVYLDAWTSTQIVLGGFGNALSGSFYHIHPGETLVFVVFGPNNSGYSTYVTYYNGPSL